MDITTLQTVITNNALTLKKYGRENAATAIEARSEEIVEIFAKFVRVSLKTSIDHAMLAKVDTLLTRPHLGFTIPSTSIAYIAP